MAKCIDREMCRLCQSKAGQVKFLLNPDLIYKICESTHVKVDDDAKFHLPDTICDDCELKVIAIFDYIQEVKDLDRCLRSLVTQSCRNDFEIFDDYNEYAPNSEGAGNKIENWSPVLNSNNSKELLADCQATLPSEDNLFCEIPDDVDLCSEHSINFEKPKHNVKKKKIKTIAKDFICQKDNCGQVFTSAYRLKIHEISHDGIKPFLCVTCGKNFTSMNSLRCHEKIHLDVKEHICKLCNIYFSIRSNLRAHEKKYHEGVRFKCAHCQKEFLTKFSRDRHEKTHDGVKEHLCDCCVASFYTAKELAKHKKYHQGIRLHKCETCFKSFFERHHLLSHMRSHTGEKPYKCEVLDCGQSFGESQKLKRHFKRKHSKSM